MENTATTNHIIPAQRNRYKDGWTSNPDNLHIVIPQLRNYIFAIGQADRGRAVYQGPLVENLAFLSARPMVIDNHGGTGADIKRAGIVVNVGDTIEFVGRTFRVEDEGDHYNAKLVEVQQ